MKITRNPIVARCTLQGVVAVAVMFLMGPPAQADSVELSKLVAFDGRSFDEYGFSVAISGDTVVVGARNSGDTSVGNDPEDDGPGAAYVYVRDDGGTPLDPNDDTFVLQAKLTVDDGDLGDQFGTSVAISGQTIVVGSPFGDGFKGAAYVFVRVGSTWSQQAKLVAGDGVVSDIFGEAIAIDGDTVVVGARGNDDAGLNAGAAYVFTRSGSSWSEQAMLTASDAAASDRFGLSVAVSIDTVVVGSPFDDNAAISSGSAYIFHRTGTTWSEQAKLTADDAARADNFGASVDIDDDTIAIGAPQDDDHGSTSGSAYVFTRDGGGTWSQQQKLTAADGASLDRFGVVAIDGDLLIVGSRHLRESEFVSGTAYLFARTGSHWKQRTKLEGTDNTTAALFASAVAISGNSVVAGSPQDNFLGDRSGVAHVFDVDAAGVTQTESVKLSSPAPNASFGNYLDLNANGTVAAVGALGEEDLGFSNAGAVHVFRFDGTDWVVEARLAPMMVDVAANNTFGEAVAIAGDALLVGATGVDGQGAAYVFRFDGTNWSQDAKLVPAVIAPGDEFGQSLDLSDDGTVAVIGSNADVMGESNAGAAYVFRFNGSVWTEEAILVSTDPDPFDDFGFGIALSADGNTVVIGSQNDDTVAPSAGAAHVFRFNGATWDHEAKLLSPTPQFGQSFGNGTTISGDGNLAVVSSTNEAAHVFRFDGATWNLEATLAVEDSSGEAVSVSADGSLLVVGAVQNGPGVAFVFRFDGTQWFQEVKFVPLDADLNVFFGLGVALAADGETALIGDANESGGGAAYVFDVLEYVVSTPTGTDVVVAPADTSTGEVVATLTFDSVTDAGATTVTTDDTGPGLPSGFQLGSPGTYYDISTTATFNGAIEICIDYSGVSYDSEAELKLLHFESGAWVDATTSLDTVNDIICGDVTSLSPFAIVNTETAADPVVLLLDLVDTVSELNIQHGIENSLDSKLDRAIEALVDVSMGNNGSAINVMQAFINAVEAQSGNQIPTSDATMLTDFAADLIAVLSLAG